MTLGIVFYNKGRKGGAERRYYNILIALSGKQKVFVLANQSLLDHWVKCGGFGSNVVIQCLENDAKVISDKHYHKSDSDPKPRKSIKYFLKSFIPKTVRNYISMILQTFRLNMIVYKWAKSTKLTHINTIQASGILAVFSKVMGCKVVFTYVDYMVENGYPFHWIRNQGLKTSVRISDKYDLLSEMVRDRMISRGLRLDSNKINIAPVSFTDYSRYFIQSRKKKIIVFSGRFEQIKNCMLALHVAKELRRRNIDFKLKMIGHGSLENEMAGFVSLNNLVDVVDIFSNEKIENDLSESLIFLSLQRENNYPSQALLEAIASGCVPIVTDVGETRRLINPGNGFLVEENPGQIADIIESVFENTKFYEERAVQARNEIMTIYSLENYMRYYNALFEG